MAVRFFPNVRPEREKICRLLFIPYINIGNLVLPPNRGRLDELDSSQFILHRNGSLKEESPPFAGGAGRAEHKMDLRCHSEPAGLMREERLLGGQSPPKFIPSARAGGVPHYVCVSGAFFNILINNNISPTRN